MRGNPLFWNVFVFEGAIFADWWSKEEWDWLSLKTAEEGKRIYTEKFEVERGFFHAEYAVFVLFSDYLIENIALENLRSHHIS